MFTAGRLRAGGSSVDAFQALSEIGTHATLGKRNALVGLAHAGIVWGFVALFIGTAIIMIDYDMVRLVNPAWRFWKGTFYLWYSALLDLSGVAFLLGLLAMMAGRWIQRPPALDYTRPDRLPDAHDRAGYVADDWLFLGPAPLSHTRALAGTRCRPTSAGPW